MATIIITLSDTPTGGIAIHADFTPAIGAPCSPAQSAALDLIARSKREFCPAPAPAPVTKPPVLREVDIDAIHRRRDRVIYS